LTILLFSAILKIKVVSLETKMLNLVFQIIGNSLGIYLGTLLIPGFTFGGDLKTLLFAGFVLGIANFFLKPILKIISFPLIILSFGLFSFVISAFILWITARFVPALQFDGIIPLFFATILISIISTILSFFAKK
jgi:putative membrane protein